MFPTLAVPFYILVVNIWVIFFFFPHPSGLWVFQFFFFKPFWLVHHDDLIVVLVCIYLIATDVENLFMGFFALCIFVSVKYPYMFFTHFLVGFFFPNCWVFRIFNTVFSTLLSVWFAHIFSIWSLSFDLFHINFNETF